MPSDEDREALQLQQADNHKHDAVPDDGGEVEGFDGPWYAFPPIRNALIAGVLLVTGWLEAVSKEM